MDKEAMRRVVFSDGLFATGKDGLSIFEDLFSMRNKNEAADLIEYASNKSIWVVNEL